MSIDLSDIRLWIELFEIDDLTGEAGAWGGCGNFNITVSFSSAGIVLTAAFVEDDLLVVLVVNMVVLEVVVVGLVLVVVFVVVAVVVEVVEVVVVVVVVLRVVVLVVDVELDLLVDCNDVKNIGQNVEYWVG